MANLFADVDESENIFEQEPSSDELFGGTSVVKSNGSTAGGDLFSGNKDDSNVVNGTNSVSVDNEEFVMTDEVLFPPEAQEINIQENDSGGTDDLDSVDGGSSEERARIRHQRRKARENECERDQRSGSPSPSPTEYGKKKSTVVISVHSSRSPTPSHGTSHSEVSENHQARFDYKSLEEARAHISALTRQLEQERLEKEALISDKQTLEGKLDTAVAKIVELEEAVKNKDAELKANSTELKEVIKKKDEEIAALKEGSKKDTSKTSVPKEGSKKDSSKASAPKEGGAKPVSKKVAELERHRPNAADSPKLRVRPGVDKSRPISSVKDSVKRFSAAGAASSSDVKKGTQVKQEGATSEGRSKTSESARASSARGEKPQPSGKKPAPAQRKPTDKKQQEEPALKKVLAKKTAEPEPVKEKVKPVTKSEVKKENPQSVNQVEAMDAPTSPTHNTYTIPVRKMIRSETSPPPAEDSSPVVVAEEATQPLTQVTQPQKSEPVESRPAQEHNNTDTSTRAKRVISMFEQKKTASDSETPSWKQQVKAAREESADNISKPPPAQSETEKTPEPVDPPVAIESQESTKTVLEPPKENEVPLRSNGTTTKQIDKRASWATGPKREECVLCGKAVYAMERLEADKVVYHKRCFKCSVCKMTLRTGTYAALQGNIYCKAHFKQLFKRKGNYDEGFGREQHKTKWEKKTGTSTTDE